MAYTQNSAVIQVTDTNFDEVVLGADRPFLLDLSAEWCGPCKAIAPIISNLATEYAGRAYVGALDIDTSPNVPTRFQVRSVPTLFVFKGGSVVGQLIGAHSRDRISDLLEQAL